MKDKEYEKLTTKERIRLNFQENSMLYKFYLWLAKKKKRNINNKTI